MLNVSRCLIQISAAQGPAECELAVRHTLRVLCREAESLGIAVHLLEMLSTSHGYRSVLLALEGAQVDVFSATWIGTVQWICASPIRSGHLRKNWFIGVHRVPELESGHWPEDGSIVFQTCKASGKGGQHINKTESAVRATHTASGLSVKVQTERSLHSNKRLARELLGIKLAALQQTHQANHAQLANALHGQTERGNPVRVFRGEGFVQA